MKLSCTGVWLFMAYSAAEETLLAPRTNLTVETDVVARLKQLPYPLKREVHTNSTVYTV